MAFDIMLSSETGRPNRETRSENLHGQEKRFKNMQKASIPSNFDRLQVINTSGIFNTSKSLDICFKKSKVTPAFFITPII